MNHTRRINSFAKYSWLTILFVFSIAITGCYDDPGTDILIGGNAFLELQDAGQPNPTITREFSQDPDGATDPVPLNVQVNIMGRQQANDITANFIVDGASTAVEGVHYRLVTAGGSLTIPKNTSFANIQIEVLPDGFDPDNDTDPWKLILKLTGGGLPLSTYTTVTYNLSAKCPYATSTFVASYSCDEPGYGTYNVTFTADATANTIINNNFWDTGLVVKYILNDANETVSIQTTEFQADLGRGSETWVITGSGTISFCTGEMIVDYLVKAKADNVVADDNTHTFRKN